MHSSTPIAGREVVGHQVGDLARVEAARQLGAHVEQAAHLAGEVLGADQQPGRPDRGRRPVGEDRQDPQIVGVEPVEAELGQGDHADDRSVVAHRHDQHRLVHVVGPFDRLSAGIRVGVVDQDRFTVLGDPTCEPDAELAREQAHVHLLVGADATLERDRDDVVRRLHDVHPGVVVLDDPGGLVHDDLADLLDRPRQAHPLRGRLEDLELGGPFDRLLEQLGVGQGDRGMRSRACP